MTFRPGLQKRGRGLFWDVSSCGASGEPQGDHLSKTGPPGEVALPDAVVALHPTVAAPRRPHGGVGPIRP